MSGRVPAKSSAYPDEKGWEEIPVHIQTIKIMKTILLCIITSIFLISCSADSDLQAAETSSAMARETSIAVQYPANPDNPFDLKGKKIYEGLQEFYKDQPAPNSISELAQQIRYVSNRLDASGSPAGRLIPFTDEMVQSIMLDPDNSMIAIVQGSVLQSYAKSSLIAFLQQLIAERQQEFSITYSYITGYESDVLSDTIFTAEETETVLTVASISRYSLYSEEERKDRDWEVLVGGKPPAPFFERNESAIISVIALLDGTIPNN